MLCDDFLANSYFTRESIYRIYGRSPSICYHGVDTTMCKPLGIERKYQVLTVVEVITNKGYDFVIKSLSTIPENYRPPFNNRRK